MMTIPAAAVLDPGADGLEAPGRAQPDDRRRGRQHVPRGAAARRRQHRRQGSRGGPQMRQRMNI